MKNLYFLISLNLVALLYSCSQTQVKDKLPIPSLSSTFFNDFIPANFPDIPSIDIKAGNYLNLVIGKYNVDSMDDSIYANPDYIKIKNAKENTIFQGQILNGKKTGLWEIIQNTKLIGCGHYISDKKCGVWKYFDFAKETQKYVNFKNDTLEGLAQEYSIDSNLLEEGHFIKGLKSGYWKHFYHGLKIKEQGYFSDGYKNGWWQKFEINGNLLEEADFLKNEICGYNKKYFNGQLFEEGKLLKGKRIGTWKLYNQTGKIKGIHEYGE